MTNKNYDKAVELLTEAAKAEAAALILEDDAAIPGLPPEWAEAAARGDRQTAAECRALSRTHIATAAALLAA